MAEVITVSALNRYVKSLFDANDRLFDLALRGEVANFVQNARSGHCYFTLRDEQASVKAVMFRSDARRLAFRPEEGMRVVVRCRATLYERDGAFQLYVNEMFPDGIGAAQLALEQLKARLEQEGLFDAAHKKPLPQYPRCIGLVTSKTGAAWQDVQNVIGRRWPMVKLLLAPVNVQGIEAERSIVAGIRALDADKRPDLILVTRGGGSKEDLWVFNSERIARAAAACRKPVVSAVGHEIDTTILDYVADLRAPTPSAAAELCVPDREEWRQKIFILQQNIQKNIQNRCEVCYNKVNALAASQTMQRQKQAMQRRETDLTRLSEAVQGAAVRRFTDAETSLRHAAAMAESLNPYGVLARGYAMVEKDGAVSEVAALQPGDAITLRGAAVRADCVVQSVHKNAQGGMPL